jgi:hypothetical protein
MFCGVFSPGIKPGVLDKRMPATNHGQRRL